MDYLRSIKEPSSFICGVLVELSSLLHLRCGLYQFFHDLIVVAILASVLVVGIIGLIVNLQLGGEVEVVGVDATRSGGEDGVAILLGPSVEDSGEEGGMAGLDLFVVGFDDHLLVEVVLHSVAQHQKVGVDASQLRRRQFGMALKPKVTLFVLLSLHPR